MALTKSQGPVTLAGAAWTKNAHFLSMHISEQLSAPFLYELEVVSDEPELASKDVLGQPVIVALEVEKKIRYFSALATSLHSVGMQGENYAYRLKLRPWLWLLSRTKNCRIFQDANVVDIVKTILSERGFPNLELKLSLGYPVRKYVVQYRETELNFIQRLLEEEGIYYYFLHDVSKHTLVLCDSPSAHVTTPFHTEIPHLPADGHRESHLDYLDTWEIVQDVESGAFVLTDYDFEAPGANLVVTKAFPEDHAEAEYEVFDFPGNYVKTKEGEAYVTNRLEMAKATAQRSLAEGNARGLLVGGLFMLSQHGVSSVNQKYLVVSQEASLHGHTLESGSNTGPMFRTSIVVIPSTRQYRPARTATKPVIHGVQTARVIGGDKIEIATDEYARVKVRFPWDRVTKENPKDNPNASCWMRVSQAWAGSHFGSIHIPRIGQEVLVEFLEGDPDRPIITGRVYNRDNMPPYTLDANQTQSGIKSRSTPNGYESNFNELRFEDKLGGEELFIHAEKQQTTKVKGDQSITVDLSRTVTVGGDQTTSVTGDETQTFHKNRTMDVTETNTETITGAHTGNYESGRTLTVTGAADVLNVTGVNREVTVEGQYTIVTSQKYELTHQDNQLLLDGPLSSLSNGKCTLSFDGAAAILSAADELRVECGSASITLTKDGTITINASQTVTVSGAQGAVELGPTGGKLSGLVASVSGTTLSEVTGAMVKIN